MANILDKLATEVDKISENDDSKAQKTATSVVEAPKDSIMDQLLSGSVDGFPKVGDTVTGIVVEVSSNEIYIDLAPFGTGVVMGKEIKDGMGNKKIRIGDTVSATLIELENEDGFIELSIREASYEKAWEDIENKMGDRENIMVKILSANKGGLITTVNGITGFLPVSQLSSKNYPRVEDGDKNKILGLLKKLVGKELEARVIDANRETEKLIVSEKAAQSEKEKEAISSFQIGDVISGEISGVVDFGAFVKFASKDETTESDEGRDRLEGLVHISELAWQLIEDPRTIVKVGDKVEAKIIGIEADKISLSIRALQKDPWSEIESKYKIGDIVTGKVHKINHFGAFVYLDRDIHGLAHISEMSELYPGKNINDLIKVGEDYSWKILSIEPKDHRMGLVLMTKEQLEKSKEKEEKKTKAKKEKEEEKKDEE